MQDITKEFTAQDIERVSIEYLDEQRKILAEENEKYADELISKIEDRFKDLTSEDKLNASISLLLSRKEMQALLAKQDKIFGIFCSRGFNFYQNEKGEDGNYNITISIYKSYKALNYAWETSKITEDRNKAKDTSWKLAKEEYYKEMNNAWFIKRLFMQITNPYK